MKNFFILIIVLGSIGWVLNIVKFAELDFQPSEGIRAEVLRGIGIVVPPVGAVEGYITINEYSE